MVFRTQLIVSVHNSWFSVHITFLHCFRNCLRYCLNVLDIFSAICAIALTQVATSLLTSLGPWPAMASTSESSESAESEQPAAEDACVDSPRPQAGLPRPQARSGRASTAASLAGGLARISLTLRKLRCCQLCNGRSTDESPLEYPTDEIFPEVEGRLPWRS